MSALQTTPFVSVEDYLRTSYRPDRDYVDGEIEEKIVGEGTHSIVQWFLAGTFFVNAEAWGITGRPECRVQVAPTRFRVPDLTILRRGLPREEILRMPPLLIIEILSPEDTILRLQQRVADYVQFGVEHLWIIDPNTRRAYVADAHGFHEPAEGSATATLTVAGTAIAVSLAELWRELDPD